MKKIPVLYALFLIFLFAACQSGSDGDPKDESKDYDKSMQREGTEQQSDTGSNQQGSGGQQ